MLRGEQIKFHGEAVCKLSFVHFQCNYETVFSQHGKNSQRGQNRRKFVRSSERNEEVPHMCAQWETTCPCRERCDPHLFDPSETRRLLLVRAVKFSDLSVRRPRIPDQVPVLQFSTYLLWCKIQLCLQFISRTEVYSSSGKQSEESSFLGGFFRVLCMRSQPKEKNVIASPESQSAIQFSGFLFGFCLLSSKVFGELCVEGCAYDNPCL